jgi:hypothetical protein
MQRQISRVGAAALVFGAASALAQSGDLAGVTLRVLDDVSGLNAAVIELDAGSGDAERAPAAADPGAEQEAPEALPAANPRADDGNAGAGDRGDRVGVDDVAASSGERGALDAPRSAVPPAPTR